jgi:DNA-binding MarR family transcriptional regulator
MTDWGFLTSHARVLLHLAHDPGARLRDIAASLGITKRRAHRRYRDLSPGRMAGLGEPAA